MKTAHDWFWSTAGVSLSGTSTEESSTGALDGTATVTISGGSGTYNYLWDDPSSQTSSTAVGLAAGDYLVIVVDSILCETFYLEITVTETVVGLNQPDTKSSVSLYPNPFSNQTNVVLTLDKPGPVKLSIANELGQVVYNNDRGTLSVGPHNIVIDGKDLTPGLYYLNIILEDKTIAKKLVLAK